MKKSIFLMTLIMTFSLAVSICSFADSNTSAFSPYWNTDSANNLHYYLSNGQAVKDAWVLDEVNGHWYLVDANGNRKVGLLRSQGVYYLFDETTGELITNGETYKGVLIKADTSADLLGALTSETVDKLKKAKVHSYMDAEHFSELKNVTNGTIVGYRVTEMKGTAEQLIKANAAYYDAANRATIEAWHNKLIDTTYTQGLSFTSEHTGKTSPVPDIPDSIFHLEGETYTKGYSHKNQAGIEIPLPDSIVSSNGVSLLDYHPTNSERKSKWRGDVLTETEIDLLVSEFNIPVPGRVRDVPMGLPYVDMVQGYALITYVDDNNVLVLPGDCVDVTGNYDSAAYGHVNLGGVASLSKIGLNS